MKKSFMMIFVVLLSAFFAFSCASGPKRTVKRTASDTTVDLSGRWNDTDSRLVAEEMIKDVLNRPWLTDFTTEEDKKPVVIVGTIRNRSSEHINTRTFVKDLERELINSGRVTFVASREERAEVREEREDQQSQSREGTASRLAAETGADFMLQGGINSIVDAVEGRKIKFYQIDMELINLETNEKAWIGSKKIKKDIAQDSKSW